MKKIIILAALILTGCARQSLRTVCTCEQQERVAEFVSDNIAASNNMSDEEMEDVISQLAKTGATAFCDQRLFWYNSFPSDGIDWSRQKLDSCEALQ